MNKLSPRLLLLLFPLLGLIIAASLLLTTQPGTVATPVPTPRDFGDLISEQPTSAPAANGLIDFTLPSLAGDTITLTDYAGRTVILNFWATWCVPCEREMPALNAYAAEQDEVIVLAINVGETEDIVRPWLEERGIDALTVLMDTDMDVRYDYGVMQFPTTYALDGDGVVQQPHFGEITLEELRVMAERVSAG
ncbi:MAG: TlpA disulfide reductase family protein [Chloroflexota bacterium]|nr:TlpA disulfide reductase family protein [Chloroflexota bacterium]